MISVAFVGLCLWGAFSVPLGEKTLADHVDAIGETSEAEQLLDGARNTINPALDEVKDRVLGEQVAAPTHLSSVDEAGAADAESAPGGSNDAARDSVAPASRAASDDDEPAGIYASDGAAPPPAPARSGPGRPSTGERVRLPGQ